MSLGGLAVAIGLIIDDTVVVIENIARHLAWAKPATRPWTRASREISGAVDRLDLDDDPGLSCRWRSCAEWWANSSSR